MSDYVFLDANILIYYGKAQLFSGNPTLDRLYIPNSKIVITSTVRDEVIGNGVHPDQTITSNWITEGIRTGRIIIEPTPGYSGKDGGEASIIGTLNDPSWDTSIPSRVISNNLKDFPSSGFVPIQSAQQYLFESLLHGGSSIAEYVIDSYNLALSNIKAGPPVLPTEALFGAGTFGSNGVKFIIENDGSVTITEPSGEVHHFGPYDRFNIDNKTGDVTFIKTSYPEYCFPAGTAILTSVGHVAIENLRPGNLVLAFDPSSELGRGALVPKRVVRLFHNETDEWLRLTWREGGEDRELTVTPGHRFLDNEGRFRRIDEIIEDAAPMVVLADGSLAQVRAERIVWSEETRHLFEEVEAVAMAAGDGLAHRTGGAWRSYNFEVEDLHTYVAGGVRVHNDSQATIDLAGNIGRTLGTQLANVLLEGESQFTKLLGGTVLGTITENLAEVITDVGYHAFNGRQISFETALSRQLKDIGPEFAASLSGAATSILVAELGEKLGLEGFGAQLFGVAGSAYAGSVIEQLTKNYTTAGSAFADVSWKTAWESVGGSLATFFGTQLAHEILPAETLEGQIGGSLGSVIGMSAGASYLGSLIGPSLGTIGNFLLPGIGAFFGTLLGTIIGDLFGSKPDPESFIDLFTDQDGQSLVTGGPLFFVTMSTKDGFPIETTEKMGLAVRDLTESYLKNIGALDLANANIDNFRLSKSHQDLTGLGANPLIRVLQQMKIDTDKKGNLEFFVNGQKVDSAEKMVDGAVVNFLKEAQPIGGDMLLKRAVAGSKATDSITLSADAAAAEEYNKYLENRETINALIAAQPDSAFAAGWVITLAQVEGLNLRNVHQTDFNGGLYGFLASLAEAGLSVDPGDVTISRSTDGKATIELFVDDKDAIPEVAWLAAQEVRVIEAGQGARLQLTFLNNMAAVGYTNVSGRIADGTEKYQVTGETAGRDLWIANDNNSYFFKDIGTHRIQIGQAEIESSDDILIGRGGNDTIEAGTGWDWADGGAGNDLIRGGDQADTLMGGTGNDTLYGERGIDYLEGGAGADVINGAGHVANGVSVPAIDLDTAGYIQSNAAVQINLTTKTAKGGHAEGDQLSYILNLVGSKYNDHLVGSAGRNVLEGGGWCRYSGRRRRYIFTLSGFRFLCAGRSGRSCISSQPKGKYRRRQGGCVP